jgi:hypothetical protein
MTSASDDTSNSELATLDADLATARAELDRIRDDMSDTEDRPDTADKATLIRAFEDQQEVVATLEERRRELLG